MLRLCASFIIPRPTSYRTHCNPRHILDDSHGLLYALDLCYMTPINYLCRDLIRFSVCEIRPAIAYIHDNVIKCSGHARSRRHTSVSLGALAGYCYCWVLARAVIERGLCSFFVDKSIAHICCTMASAATMTVFCEFNDKKR